MQAVHMVAEGKSHKMGSSSWYPQMKKHGICPQGIKAFGPPSFARLSGSWVQFRSCPSWRTPAGPRPREWCIYGPMLSCVFRFFYARASCTLTHVAGARCAEKTPLKAPFKGCQALAHNNYGIMEFQGIRDIEDLTLYHRNESQGPLMLRAPFSSSQKRKNRSNWALSWYLSLQSPDSIPCTRIKSRIQVLDRFVRRGSGARVQSRDVDFMHLKPCRR